MGYGDDIVDAEFMVIEGTVSAVPTETWVSDEDGIYEIAATATDIPQGLARRDAHTYELPENPTFFQRVLHYGMTTGLLDDQFRSQFEREARLVLPSMVKRDPIDGTVQHEAATLSKDQMVTFVELALGELAKGDVAKAAMFLKSRKLEHLVERGIGMVRDEWVRLGTRASELLRRHVDALVGTQSEGLALTESYMQSILADPLVVIPEHALMHARENVQSAECQLCGLTALRQAGVVFPSLARVGGLDVLLSTFVVLIGIRQKPELPIELADVRLFREICLQPGTGDQLDLTEDAEQRIQVAFVAIANRLPEPELRQWFLAEARNAIGLTLTQLAAATRDIDYRTCAGYFCLTVRDEQVARRRADVEDEAEERFRSGERTSAFDLSQALERLRRTKLRPRQIAELFEQAEPDLFIQLLVQWDVPRDRKVRQMTYYLTRWSPSAIAERLRELNFVADMTADEENPRAFLDEDDARYVELEPLRAALDKLRSTNSGRYHEVVQPLVDELWRQVYGDEPDAE